MTSLKIRKSETSDPKLQHYFQLQEKKLNIVKNASILLMNWVRAVRNLEFRVFFFSTWARSLSLSLAKLSSLCSSFGTPKRRAEKERNSEWVCGEKRKRWRHRGSAHPWYEQRIFAKPHNLIILISRAGWLMIFCSINPLSVPLLSF